MARIYENHDEYRNGDLILESQTNGDIIDVFYIPSIEKLVAAGLKPDEAHKYRVKLLEIDTLNGRLTMLPINTKGDHRDFLGPKYEKVKRITLADAKPVLSFVGDNPSLDTAIERSITFGPTKTLDVDINKDNISDPLSKNNVMEILEDLPRAFTKDYDYGLGLAQPYRFIINAIEELSDCDEIVISHEHRTEINHQENIFYIQTNDFEKIRKSLNNITNTCQIAAISAKSVKIHNLLAKKLGKQEIPLQTGRSPLRKFLTKVAHGEGKFLSDKGQEEVIDVITDNVKSIVESKPDKLIKLQGDIELGSLDVVIEKYKKMLIEKKGENTWQSFLNMNPFILSMAFGHPIIMVQEKASVGGRKLSGKGDKLTDFLVKNSMTDNTAIVEIKTPQTKLLNTSTYRDGVYTPSSDLSGSINQALAQKYQLEHEFTIIKDNSDISDIKSYSVHCCLIIGTMPKEMDQSKSFELFRRNSKAVEIITFDELLTKLEKLRDFLTSSDEEKSVQSSDVDLPF